jgi:hypothetical protein
MFESRTFFAALASKDPEAVGDWYKFGNDDLNGLLITDPADKQDTGKVRRRETCLAGDA